MHNALLKTKEALLKAKDVEIREIRESTAALTSSCISAEEGDSLKKQLQETWTEFLKGLIKADAAELVSVSVQPYNEDTGSEGGTDWFGKATASAAKADADAEGMYGLSASRPSMSGE
eukprot:gene14936-20991_t